MVGLSTYRVGGNGAYNLHTSQSVSVYNQGIYTLRAWVKISAGSQADNYLVVQHYSGPSIWHSLSASSTNWTLIEIQNIDFTSSRSVEIALSTTSRGGNEWIAIDDIELIKQ